MYKPICQFRNKDEVLCSMCEKKATISETLVPSICFKKNIERAHRICKTCWWKKNIGFATEDREHMCPGCKKGLPMLPKKDYGIINIDD